MFQHTLVTIMSQIRVMLVRPTDGWHRRRGIAGAARRRQPRSYPSTPSLVVLDGVTGHGWCVWFSHLMVCVWTCSLVWWDRDRRPKSCKKLLPMRFAASMCGALALMGEPLTLKRLLQRTDGIAVFDLFFPSEAPVSLELLRELAARQLGIVRNTSLLGDACRKVGHLRLDTSR